jgi:hypothetical protein
MAHFVFPAVAVILSVPFVAISYNAAAAQERGTCSQARVTVRHPASLPEAVPSLHGNWLLDRRALEKMRNIFSSEAVACITPKTCQVRQPITEMSSPHSMVSNQKNRSRRLACANELD